MPVPCKTPLSAEVLTEYWLEELEPQAEMVGILSAVARETRVD